MTSSSVSNARRFVKDLPPGEKLEDQVFLVAQKDLRTTSNGALYIHAVLADKTGQVLGRIWQATEMMYNQIPDGGFLRIRGRTESFKGSLQVIIDAICPVPATEVNLADFVPASECDVGKMWSDMLGILRTVRNPQLLTLIERFVKDDDVVIRFKQSPAAVKMHHAYVGGLLEHTLSLLRLATRIFGEKDSSTSMYPKLDRDLILTGILLHDIGKAWELSCEAAFKYTTDGQLMGHIVQGVMLIDRKCAEIASETGKPFPEALKTAIVHLVLSHHGSYEFGSPRLPAMPEAIALHHLDNLDAKVNQFTAAIDGDSDEKSEWTEYVPSLSTRVYKRRDWSGE